MTPEEKAIELYEKYDSLFKAPYKKHKDTKLCALIAVDEVLDIIRYHGTDIGKHSLLFWQQVKKEIEKL
jgi:hypothetical protein